MTYFIGTLAECEEQEILQDKMADLPRAGVHVGGGIHVPMPEAWRGRKGSPGWSSHQEGALQHPSKAEFAIKVAEGDRSKITPAERVAHDSRKAAAIAALPIDWSGTVARGEKIEAAPEPEDPKLEEAGSK